MDKQYTMLDALAAIIIVLIGFVLFIWLMEGEPYNPSKPNNTFNHKQVQFDSLVVEKDYELDSAIETLSNRIKEQNIRIEQLQKGTKRKQKIGDHTYEPNSKW